MIEISAVVFKISKAAPNKSLGSLFKRERGRVFPKNPNKQNFFSNGH